MGLDFSKMPTPPQNTKEGQVAVKNEIEEVKQYDIVEERKELNAKWVGSKEVPVVTSGLNQSTALSTLLTDTDRTSF